MDAATKSPGMNGLKPMMETARASTMPRRGINSLMTNDTKELRRRFTFPRGERPAESNIVLKLIDELEALRAEIALQNKTNLELAKQLAALK